MAFISLPRPALGLSVMLALVGSTTTGWSQQTPVDQLYVNPVYGWSVTYPKDWKVDNQDPAFVKIQPPPNLPQGLIGFHSVARSGDKSLDEFADRMMAHYADRSRGRGRRFEVLSRRSMVLPDGTPVVEIVNLLGTGVVGKSRKIFALREGRAFTIDAETYLDAWPRLEVYFDRMINSFTVRH